MSTRPAGASSTHSEPSAARPHAHASGDVMPHDSLEDVGANSVADETRLGQVNDILRQPINQGRTAD